MRCRKWFINQQPILSFGCVQQSRRMDPYKLPGLIWLRFYFIFLEKRNFLFLGRVGFLSIYQKNKRNQPHDAAVRYRLLSQDSGGGCCSIT